MEYSAVTHPEPRPAIQRGTESSMVAVQMTLVSPISIKHDPSAYGMNPGVRRTARSSAASLPSDLKATALLGHLQRSVLCDMARLGQRGRRISFWR